MCATDEINSRKSGLDIRYPRMTSDELSSEIYKINNLMQIYAERHNINIDDIFFNYHQLVHIVVRIDKRKYYMTYFHHGMVMSEYKLTMLLVYWINKLKPFTYKGELFNLNGDRIIDINLDFCIFLVLSLLNKLNGSELENEANFIYIRDLKYSLVFRDLTKEALYLIVDYFYCSAFARNKPVES